MAISKSVRGRKYREKDKCKRRKKGGVVVKVTRRRGVLHSSDPVSDVCLPVSFW